MNRWLLIGSAVLSLQAQSAQHLVPAELVASARLSPIDFVATLANGALPSGIEIRSADTTVSLATWTRVTSSEPAAFGSGSVDASLLITTFNRVTMIIAQRSSTVLRLEPLLGCRRIQPPLL